MSYVPPADAENAALLIAMDSEARLQGSQSRALVYEAILNSRLLVPVPSLPHERPATGEGAAHDVKIAFFGGTNSQGEKWTAAFTGEDALRAWDGVSPIVRVEARRYFKLMLAAGINKILINPSREKMLVPGGWLYRHEFEMLADGVIPVEISGHHAAMKMEAGTRLVFDAPVCPLPQRLIDALPKVVRGIRGLSEIYHFNLSINGGTPRSALGVRGGRGLFPMSPDKIAREVMTRLGPFLDVGETLDVIPLEPVGYPEKAEIVWRHSWQFPNQT